ncbi:MAG: type II toxin-antitoxin system VapC family toxin [Pirellulales bacterium]
MTFDDLDDGESLFLDANTLVYHFSAHPIFGPACGQLMARIEKQAIIGYTSTQLLSNVAHRLMTIEASAAFGWPFAGIATRLKRHHSEIPQLAQFRAAIESAANSEIRVLTIPSHLIARAAAISQQFELLSDDALVVALMQEHGLTHLASYDADFDRVPSLTRYGAA